MIRFIRTLMKTSFASVMKPQFPIFYDEVKVIILRISHLRRIDLIYGPLDNFIFRLHLLNENYVIN